MQCPNCQTTNPPQAKFCLECGLRLVRCSNCGTVNPPQAKFCMECGSTIQAQTVTQSSNPGNGNSPATITSLDPQTTQSSLSYIIDVEPVRTTTPGFLVHPEERRIVTLMFADITGSTPLAGRLDPEDLRAILTGYFNLMAEQIRKHGGTVEKYIGDAVMAVFGLPSAHENDPERAIRAALDMQEALNRFNSKRQSLDPQATRLQMRIGINTGEVAAPTNALTQGQDFLVTGDAVNVAARLQQITAPDTILVGERTYLSSRDCFEFRTITPLSLKGKAEPITAYKVIGPRQIGALRPQQPWDNSRHQAPIIGRSLELTLLHASYARVQAERHSHLITILGVPGIGKTRLINEFIARELELAQGAVKMGERTSPLILKGRCPPYGEGVTYWPLIEIIRTLLQVNDTNNLNELHARFKTFVKETLTQAKRTETAEEITDILLSHIGRNLQQQHIEEDATRDRTAFIPHQHNTPTRNTASDPKQSGTRAALLRAWRVFFEALGATHPLIIVVEDIQWADEALLDLLEHLTDRITTTPILFLCPARPDFFEQRRDWGGGHRNFTTIELDALSWEESNELIDMLLPINDIPESLRYTILARAEGNPFFVEEIIRMLIDQGVLVQHNHQKGQICWEFKYQNTPLLQELSVSGEHSEDLSLNQHYILPIPHVPDTIQGVLAARVDLLPINEKLILQYAAIIGRTFWLSALWELASGFLPDGIIEALASLLRRDFIVESNKRIAKLVDQDRVFHFKHILIRDVVYNHIPRQRRAREHARLALWLENRVHRQKGTITELLAHHYQQALVSWSNSWPLDTLKIESSSDQPPIYLTKEELRQRAIHYLLEVGDLALQGYYSLRALRAYNDAYELVGDRQGEHLLLLSKIHQRLGDAYTQRWNFTEACKNYKDALNVITKPEQENTQLPEIEQNYLLHLYERLALLGTRWMCHFFDGNEVQNYINAGLQLLEGNTLRREHIAFLTYQTMWYTRQLNKVSGEQKTILAEQALSSSNTALQQAEELGNPYVISLVLDAKGFLYEQLHRYTEALGTQIRRMELEDQLTDREEIYDLYYSMAKTSLSVGSYQEALSWVGRAWSIGKTIESPAMLINSTIWRMYIWHQWNRWDNAQKAGEEVLRLCAAYQQDTKQLFNTVKILARIAYHKGEHERAEQYSKQCRRLADQYNEQKINSEQKQSFSLKLGTLYYAEGNITQAIAVFKEQLAASEPFPSPKSLAILAEALTAIPDGDPALQRSISERAVMSSEQSGARKSLAVALRARGVGQMQQRQWDQAEQDLRRALQICHELDLPWEQGNTLYQLGKLFVQKSLEGQSTHNVQQARYYLEQAIDFYTSLGAKPGLEQAQHELAQISDREQQPVSSLKP